MTFPCTKTQNAEVHWHDEWYLTYLIPSQYTPCSEKKKKKTGTSCIDLIYSTTLRTPLAYSMSSIFFSPIKNKRQRNIYGAKKNSHVQRQIYIFQIVAWRASLLKVTTHNEALSLDELRSLLFLFHQSIPFL